MSKPPPTVGPARLAGIKSPVVPAPGGLARSGSVLIVDDEALLRETVAEYLAQEGFEVAACSSGEEALTLAADRYFDVVLCDLNLPGIDGIELLQRLLQRSPQTFVLLITAYATVENAVEAF